MILMLKLSFMNATKTLDYIPAGDDSYRLFTRFDLPYWVPRRRVPLDTIKVDKSLFLQI